jgi:YidC/Oxa1 family membrane protein insertase
MSSEKRLVLTVLLSFVIVLGLQYALQMLGLVKPPAPQPPPIAAIDKAKAENEKALDILPDDVFTPDSIKAQLVDLPSDPKRAKPEELVIGADNDESPTAYHLRVQLVQTGASVLEATTAKYDAEINPEAPRQPEARRPRLKLIDRDRGSKAPNSLAMTLISNAKADKPINAENGPLVVEAPRTERNLDTLLWEVVRDNDDAPAVKRLTRTDPSTKLPVEGQEIRFRKTSTDPVATVTKTFRIWQGEDGFEVELAFSSPKTDSKFTYHLFGTHGIPIEGAWYTSAFRDVFFGQFKDGSIKITPPLSSSEIVKYKGDKTWNRFSTVPLTFAGVEDQYFATFLEPSPIPKSSKERIEQEAGPVIFTEDFKQPQFSDVGVELFSPPIVVGPNLGEVVHKYKVFAGPKLTAVLAPYEAEDLASYRKQWIPIPYASELARYVISPLLDKIYLLTKAVAGLFGWKNGNYGIAIILLTMTVRLIMFPLSRKQAIMAKKMQDLQPIIAQVKEKYKDDKEALTRETMEVWKRHKVNPAAGCLPALIQMPIFVGLWQSLNNSVALRHSSFLYIRDLAAPDMAFHLPFSIPFINAEYLNILPFLVVALMLLQTKLFSPPPTTPEQEQSQKIMKYMMIFMAFMFYKVPSGLGLYFITSSLWQVCERLLLPKILPNTPKPAEETDEFGGDRGKGPGGGNGRGPNGNGNGGGGAQGWLGKKLEKLLEEAAKDKTIRNANVGLPNGRDKDREREREPERDRPRPRPKPGKRR